jgi:crotonobetainyl-CoA:carnitine CoA-transferase CaiB-like acyl-CoA transferase
VPALLPPAVSGRAEARMDAVPALGAHTDALLAEIGFDRTAIARMHGTGVV